MSLITNFSHSLQKNLRMVSTNSGKLESKTNQVLCFGLDPKTDQVLLTWTQPTDNFHRKKQTLERKMCKSY